MNVFKFKPNLQALENSNIFNNKPGIFKTDIIDAEIDETRNGSPLLRLILIPENCESIFILPIAVSENPITHKYFKNFCESIGLNYPKNGELNLDDIVGKNGLVKYVWKSEWITVDNLTKKKTLIAKYFVKNDK
jgi:hypothetical protein